MTLWIMTSSRDLKIHNIIYKLICLPFWAKNEGEEKKFWDVGLCPVLGPLPVHRFPIPIKILALLMAYFRSTSGLNRFLVDIT